MDEIDSQIKRLSTPNKSIILNASHLLNIADNLFKSSKPEQKNKILKLLLSTPPNKRKKALFRSVRTFSHIIKLS